MLKKLIPASILLSLQTQAHNMCEFQNGSYLTSNSALTPAFFINKDNHRAHFFITNISEKTVDVKIELTDANGAGYVPHTITYSGNFSASNSPFNIQQGATLAPGELGELSIKEQTNTPSLVNVGKVTWFAEGCEITEALQVGVQRVAVDSGRGRAVETLLNNGMPF